MVAQARVNVERVRGNLWRVGSERVVLTSTGAMFCTCADGQRGRACEHTPLVQVAWLSEMLSQIKQSARGGAG